MYSDIYPIPLTYSPLCKHHNRRVLTGGRTDQEISLRTESQDSLFRILAHGEGALWSQPVYSVLPRLPLEFYRFLKEMRRSDIYSSCILDENKFHFLSHIEGGCRFFLSKWIYFSPDSFVMKVIETSPKSSGYLIVLFIIDVLCMIVLDY